MKRGATRYGEAPCWAECANTACPWCAFGMCADNATCDAQTKEGGER